MKRITIMTLITLISTLLFVGVATTASIPARLTYQGRLTDSSGTPVPDNPYLIRLRLYDAASAGSILWDSNIRQVDVAGGLFSYNLGDSVVLPIDIFKNNPDIWVGVKVGVDPEISPRTKINSQAFSFESHHSDTADLALDADSLGGSQPTFYLDWNNFNNIPAGFADGTDDEGISQSTADGLYVKLAGDVMTGVLESPVLIVGTPSTITGKMFIYKSSGTIPSIEIKPFMTSHYLAIKDVNSGQFLASLEPDGSVGGGGYLAIRKDLLGTIGFKVDGNSGSFGEPTVSVLGSARSVVFDMNATGDNSVSLPTDAISSQEMLNESGIAFNRSTTYATFVQGYADMIDIITVTITTPTSGYLVVQANANGFLQGTTGSNYGITQIDETPGGAAVAGQQYWWGYSTGSTAVQYSNVSHTRVYYKSAGTYTFRLEGKAFGGNASGAVTRVFASWILATFVPTSYGAVATISPTPGDHPDTERITVVDPDGTTSATYKMDLRYYELKARVAREAAQAAELELKQAIESKDIQAASSNNIDARR